MARWQNRYWIAFGSSSLASGVQLLLNTNAFAHGGSHGEDTEPASSSASGEQHHIPPSEAVEAGSEQSEPEAMVMPMDTTDDTSIQEVQGAQESLSASISNASVSEGLSIGLGESLLGFIIAGPFLLISLKKKLQS